MSERASDSMLAKVPEVTLAFWIVKLLATTLGETGGDAVSMSLGLGYLVGTAIFATTTVGTTLADFADRSLGIGYAGGSALLLTLLLASLYTWHRVLGSIDVTTVSSPKSEMFYWVTIMFSQTLGTALGDWTADTAGMGYLGSALVFGVMLGLLALAYYQGDRFARGAVLGSVYPDSSAGRGGRRLSGQAARVWRAGPGSFLGVVGVDRVDRGLPVVLHPESRAETALTSGGCR